MRCVTVCLIGIGVIWSCFAEQAVSEKNEGRIASKVKTLQAMQKDIEGLRADNNRWRAIRWNRCLLKGLGLSRKNDKPIVFWVFLHNPNEERC